MHVQNELLEPSVSLPVGICASLIVTYSYSVMAGHPIQIRNNLFTGYLRLTIQSMLELIAITFKVFKVATVA